MATAETSAGSPPFVPAPAAPASHKAATTAAGAASRRSRQDGQGESRIFLPRASWALYEQILEAVGDGHVRITYDRGCLELMAPLYEHDAYAESCGLFVDKLAVELEIPYQCGGTTTFKKQAAERGLEADKCFWIKNVAKIIGKKKIDLETDPPPDLAVEIDITSSSINRLAIYAALGVAEVWRFDGELLRVYHLEHGQYVQASQSLAFPFLPLDEFAEILKKSTELDRLQLSRTFYDWLRTRVVPLWKQTQGGGEQPSS